MKSLYSENLFFPLCRLSEGTPAYCKGSMNKKRAPLV